MNKFLKLAPLLVIVAATGCRAGYSRQISVDTSRSDVQSDRPGHEDAILAAVEEVATRYAFRRQAVAGLGDRVVAGYTRAAVTEAGQEVSQAIRVERGREDGQWHVVTSEHPIKTPSRAMGEVRQALNDALRARLGRDAVQAS